MIIINIVTVVNADESAALLESVDEGDVLCPCVATAVLPSTASYGDMAGAALDGIVIEFNHAVIEEGTESLLIVEEGVACVNNPMAEVIRSGYYCP